MEYYDFYWKLKNIAYRFMTEGEIFALDMALSMTHPDDRLNLIMDTLDELAIKKKNNG